MPETFDYPRRVVVVHGLGANRWIMGILCWRLRRRGLAVFNFGYRSLRLTLQEAGQQLSQAIVHFEKQYPEDTSPIHFVAHSMGGIVLRVALALSEKRRTGRIVFMGSPHYGTPVADRWYGRLKFIPAVYQLRTHTDSDIHQIPVPSTDCWEMGTMSGKYDRIVPAAYTRIRGEKDHIQLPMFHTMIFRSRVARQAAAFLDSGWFQK